LILDLHAAPGGQGNDLPISDRDSSRAPLWQDSAAQNKTVALWTRLAERYVREPWIGAYDLINEPNWNFSNPQDRNGCNDSSNAPLRAFYMRLTEAVRRVDTNHLVIIEGNCWGNNYRGVLPPWDGNMALSFHKYWNDNNDGAIAGIADLRKRYGIPVWMGESGVVAAQEDGNEQPFRNSQQRRFPRRAILAQRPGSEARSGRRLPRTDATGA
ncbi:MAG: hypothetical protein EOO12_17410, partial [Chitinophagaceae bacterium]